MIQARGPRPSPRCALYVDAMIAAMPASPWIVLARIIRLACRHVTDTSPADACQAEFCMCNGRQTVGVTKAVLPDAAMMSRAHLRAPLGAQTYAYSEEDARKARKILPTMRSSKPFIWACHSPFQPKAHSMAHLVARKHALHVHPHALGLRGLDRV